MAEKRWIAETLFDDLGFRMTYEVERVLYEMQTEHQHLVLFEHKFFGKMLMLDGATQVTSKDEFIYHEMMTHVPIFAHGKAREVLIVGGGDCGIAEEVLKHKIGQAPHPGRDRCLGGRVLQGALSRNSPGRCSPTSASICVIDDGMKYVARTDRRFDVIIVDSTDPQGPGKVLFSDNSIAACRRCMKPGGVMVTQNGVPILQSGELIAGITQVPQAVRRRLLLRCGDPDLRGRPHGHGLGDRQRKLRTLLGVDHRRPLQARPGASATKYWTPESPRCRVRFMACIAAVQVAGPAMALLPPWRRSGPALRNWRAGRMRPAGSARFALSFATSKLSSIMHVVRIGEENLPAARCWAPD